MLDELVRQAQLQHRDGDAGGVQGLGHGAAGTAHQATVFDGDDRVVATRQFGHQLSIQRLHKAHVGDRGVETLGGLQRRVEQRAKGQDGHALPAAADLALAPGLSRHLLDWCDAGAGTTRVAHRDRAVVLEAGVEGLATFVLVGRRQHRHVRNAARVGNVVIAGMRRAVGADEAGAVEREQHRQVLDGHVVHELVVGALQEGRVDRDDRLDALAGQARGEGDRMLLGDADIVITLREALVELDHARTLAHRRRDAHEPRVGLGHVAQPVAEDLGEGQLGRRGRLDEAHRRVELARGRVVLDRVGLGQLVAGTLLGDDVQELRALFVAQVLQRRHEGVEVVAVDRADVVEAEFLEDRARHHHALGVLLELARKLVQRRVLQHALRAFAGRGVEAAAHQPRQVFVQRADRRADRHVVVVQDHQQVAQQATVRHAGVIQGLEGHAGRHRAVADDGHRLVRQALQLESHRHAMGGRDRRGRMAGAEGVVLALVTAREAADAAELAQPAHAVAPTGQHLVRVGLVADVPHQPVLRGVENVMQSYRQLDRAQVGAQVAAGAGDALQHIGANLVGQLLELGAGQPTQIGRAVDAFEQRVVHRETLPLSCRARRRSRPVGAATACQPGRWHPVPPWPGTAVAARVRGQAPCLARSHRWACWPPGPCRPSCRAGPSPA
mmetsp:Transcript_85589/g.238151  ORF Transcript_85589/g.238151 Transcript_85589/m.238151 type:complete len:669 (-) Transcript_85589:2867-4873(-)